MTDEAVKTVSLVEGRRRIFENFLWQVPAVSFTGQAFILTIVLRRTTSPLGRLVAASFGLCAAIAVLQAFVRHRWTEEAHSEWLNSREQGTGVPLTTVLLDEAFPPTAQTTSHWSKEPEWVQWLGAQSAFVLWRRVLALFVLADAFLVFLAVLELCEAWAPLASGAR
ncbi:MAG TPA: hypothetical protein VKR21_17675 [Solirubrobacteraceae bacterium]|nr:hypothetical protein [Solirubrobacteraceae bacterium]